MACGTISPTKAIGPATAATAAQSTTPAAAARARVRPTCTPRPRATSSPSASEFIPDVRQNTTIAATTIRGATIAIDDQSGASRMSSTCQKRNSFIAAARGQQYGAHEGGEGGSDGGAGQRELDGGGAARADGSHEKHDDPAA